MATTARTRIESARKAKSANAAPSPQAIDDFLDEVMVSVSDSLDRMTPEQRERAVSAAEKAVSHLPHN
jgi:hypothetical protein